jgi:hypothetical protein
MRKRGEEEGRFCGEEGRGCTFERKKGTAVRKRVHIMGALAAC